MYQVSAEVAEARVRSGESWSDFCDMLKAAGMVLQRPGVPDDPRVRAEGVRYLTRVLRAGLEAFVEHADPAAPTLRRVVHETSKLGNDNPDSYYLNAEIDGTRSYLLRGRRNTVRFVEFATQIGSYGEGGGMPPSGHLDGRDLVVDAEGRFEVWIGPERRGLNWLPTAAGTRTMIIRQNRLDPATETLCELELLPAEGPATPAHLSPVAVDVGLMKAAMLVATAPQLFSEWMDGFQAHVNALPRFDQATSDRMGGVPFIRYHHSAWRLGPEEALVVRVPAWPCDHWNLQVSNHWLESLDYRHRRIHTNSVLATSRADASAVVVISDKDPGVPNWLTTDGHREGAMCFRWVRPEPFDAPEPRCEVVPLGSVAGVVA